MGLTIHYSGMLRNSNLIDEIIAEASDIGENLHWSVEHIPAYPDVPVRGVLLAPEKSEPVWLTFHEDGFLCNPLLYEQVLKTTNESISAVNEQWLFTKTQYAGAESHMAIIQLLRHLSQKYFSRFELHDESNFWETGDENECRKRFGEYNRLMDMVGNTLDNMNIHPGETQESVIKRIKKVFSQKGFQIKITKIN
jgi:hypothetical protein